MFQPPSGLLAMTVRSSAQEETKPSCPHTTGQGRRDHCFLCPESVACTHSVPRGSLGTRAVPLCPPLRALDRPDKPRFQAQLLLRSHRPDITQGKKVPALTCSRPRTEVTHTTPHVAARLAGEPPGSVTLTHFC